MPLHINTLIINKRSNSSLLLWRIHLTIEHYLLLLQHLLQYLRRLSLTVCIIQISLVHSLQQQVDLLQRFWTVSVQNTQNQTLNYMTQVTLHWSTLLQQRTLNVIVYFILYNVRILIHRLIRNYLRIFYSGGHSPHAQSMFWHSIFLDYSFMNPKGHFLLDKILRNLQLITQLLWRNRILHLTLIKIRYHNSLNRKTLKIKISIRER